VSLAETKRDRLGEERACDVVGRKYRVLFLGPGPVPPSQDPRENLQFHISEFCEGDLVSTHWGPAKEYAGRSLTDVYDTLGSFRYHAILTESIPRPFRSVGMFGYVVRTGLRLSRTQGSFDAIVTYGAFSFAVAGWLLRRMTGAKLVITIPGPPLGGFAYEGGMFNKIKSYVARCYVPRLLRSADALRLYFPTQLEDLRPGCYPRAFVFPNLVPVSVIASSCAAHGGWDGRYGLILGHPFERKGVDVLIKAFQLITERHPDFSLKIVGYCPDLAPYRELAGGNPRIEFLPGQPHDRAMKLLAGCTFFVLPSRAEGVPRVLIEAMAAKKPIIASRVHGIPYLVEDGLHGLLVEPEDVQGLASKMELLLSAPVLAARLAEESHRRVFGRFSEASYREGFRKLMEYLVPQLSPGL
jgi:glycosyltransferase involved in cell wall biosynthesis